MSESVLNDDCLINVTMTNNQWNIVIDWLVHTPYQQAKEILGDLNKQIDQVQKQSTSDGTFTGTLSIKTFNLLIFALGQAPYYLIAEIIQKIYDQGQSEIARLKEQAATIDKEKVSNAPVEILKDSPDNSNIEQTKTETKTRKRSRKSQKTTIKE